MIIFMGVAGAGKSMQGRLLADTLALPWLSTGEFLRMLIAGEKRKQMLAGKLLGDEEIINLIQRMFSVVDVDSEFILDGFPRSTGQADWLLNQKKYGQLNITAIVHITASSEIVQQRLLERGRQDDHHEAIKARFEEYEETIIPILQQFRTDNIPVIDIDGEKTIEEVHQSIIQKLNGIIRK